jgi:hypothetical protein
MDGEKDPRNLLIALRIVKTIAEVYDISECAQDLFETCFCYFPITFKPPPDDPYGISSHDLKEALRKCLASSPLFAPHAIPCFLEKLESSNWSAKRDTLLLLHDALPIYGSASLIPSVPRLWKLLKNEIFYSSDAAHEESALKTLGIVLSVLSVTGESRTNPVDLILNPGVHECLQHLSKPETKLARISAQMLRYFVESDIDIASNVLTLAAPFILSHLSPGDIQLSKKTLVEGLVQLLRGCEKHHVLPPALISFSASFSYVFNVSCQSSLLSLASLGLQGFYSLMMLEGLLSTKEQESCALEFLMCLDSPHSSIQVEAISHLSKLSNTHPELIKSLVIPDILLKLCDDSNLDVHHNARVGALVELATNERFSPQILQSLILELHKCNEISKVHVLASIILKIVEGAGDIKEEHVREILIFASKNEHPRDLECLLAQAIGLMMRKLKEYVNGLIRPFLV